MRIRIKYGATKGNVCTKFPFKINDFNVRDAYLLSGPVLLVLQFFIVVNFQVHFEGKTRTGEVESLGGLRT